jgi:hypothetical protein
MAEQDAANIQIFGNADEAPDDLARRVARAIKEALTGDGFEAIPASEASDRELAVVISNQKGRATVLDEAGDGQRDGVESLARHLSQTLDALTVSVVGSAHLPVIALHGGGATLSVLPEDAKEEELHGAWGDLLVGGNTPADLKQVWFAPGNPLVRTAEILSVEPSLMTVNYSALGRLGRAGARLRFKSKDGTATAAGPRLRAAAKPGQALSPAPGEPFTVAVVVQNRGSASKGVDVTLRGRLLTEEWMEIRSARLQTSDFREEQRPRFRVVRNDRVYQARFEAAPLPGSDSSDVLELTLECQLTRTLPSPEQLKIALEAMGSSSGGCSVDVAISPKR